MSTFPDPELTSFQSAAHGARWITHEQLAALAHDIVTRRAVIAQDATDYLPPSGLPWSVIGAHILAHAHSALDASDAEIKTLARNLRTYDLDIGRLQLTARDPRAGATGQDDFASSVEQLASNARVARDFLRGLARFLGMGDTLLQDLTAESTRRQKGELKESLNLFLQKLDEVRPAPNLDRDVEVQNALRASGVPRVLKVLAAVGKMPAAWADRSPDDILAAIASEARSYLAGKLIYGTKQEKKDAQARARAAKRTLKSTLLGPLQAQLKSLTDDDWVVGLKTVEADESAVELVGEMKWARLLAELFPSSEAKESLASAVRGALQRVAGAIKLDRSAAMALSIELADPNDENRASLERVLRIALAVDPKQTLVEVDRLLEQAMKKATRASVAAFGEEIVKARSALRALASTWDDAGILVGRAERLLLGGPQVKTRLPLDPTQTEEYVPLANPLKRIWHNYSRQIQRMAKPAEYLEQLTTFLFATEGQGVPEHAAFAIRANIALGLAGFADSRSGEATFTSALLRSIADRFHIDVDVIRAIMPDVPAVLRNMALGQSMRFSPFDPQVTLATSYVERFDEEVERITTEEFMRRVSPETMLRAKAAVAPKQPEHPGEVSLKRFEPVFSSSKEIIEAIRGQPDAVFQQVINHSSWAVGNNYGEINAVAKSLARNAALDIAAGWRTLNDLYTQYGDLRGNPALLVEAERRLASGLYIGLAASEQIRSMTSQGVALTALYAEIPPLLKAWPATGTYETRTLFGLLMAMDYLRGGAVAPDFETAAGHVVNLLKLVAPGTAKAAPAGKATAIVPKTDRLESHLLLSAAHLVQFIEEASKDSPDPDVLQNKLKGTYDFMEKALEKMQASARKEDARGYLLPLASAVTDAIESVANQFLAEPYEKGKNPKLKPHDQLKEVIRNLPTLAKQKAALTPLISLTPATHVFSDMVEELANDLVDAQQKGLELKKAAALSYLARALERSVREAAEALLPPDRTPPKVAHPFVAFLKDAYTALPKETSPDAKVSKFIELARTHLGQYSQPGLSTMLRPVGEFDEMVAATGLSLDEARARVRAAIPALARLAAAVDLTEAHEVPSSSYAAVDLVEARWRYASEAVRGRMGTSEIPVDDEFRRFIITNTSQIRLEGPDLLLLPQVREDSPHHPIHFGALSHAVQELLERRNPLSERSIEAKSMLASSLLGPTSLTLPVKKELDPTILAAQPLATLRHLKEVADAASQDEIPNIVQAAIEGAKKVAQSAITQIAGVEPQPEEVNLVALRTIDQQGVAAPSALGAATSAMEAAAAEEKAAISQEQVLPQEKKAVPEQAAKQPTPPPPPLQPAPQPPPAEQPPPEVEQKPPAPVAFKDIEEMPSQPPTSQQVGAPPVTEPRPPAPAEPTPRAEEEAAAAPTPSQPQPAVTGAPTVVQASATQTPQQRLSLLEDFESFVAEAIRVLRSIKGDLRAGKPPDMGAIAYLKTIAGKAQVPGDLIIGDRTSVLVNSFVIDVYRLDELARSPYVAREYLKDLVDHLIDSGEQVRGVTWWQKNRVAQEAQIAATVPPAAEAQAKAEAGKPTEPAHVEVKVEKKESKKELGSKIKQHVEAFTRKVKQFLSDPNAQLDTSDIDALIELSQKAGKISASSLTEAWKTIGDLDDYVRSLPREKLNILAQELARLRQGLSDRSGAAKGWLGTRIREVETLGAMYDWFRRTYGLELDQAISAAHKLANIELPLSEAEKGKALAAALAGVRMRSDPAHAPVAFPDKLREALAASADFYRSRYGALPQDTATTPVTAPQPVPPLGPPSAGAGWGRKLLVAGGLALGGLGVGHFIYTLLKPKPGDYARQQQQATEGIPGVYAIGPAGIAPSPGRIGVVDVGHPVTMIAGGTVGLPAGYPIIQIGGTQ